jgi:mRNA-degrading endonuclease toxin of MazEF toxin-antitoxin module
MEGYIKNFDGWNEVKKKLNETVSMKFFSEGEVWWCSTGVNIGVEMDGKGEKFTRPVLILKIVNSQTFIGVPLTSTLKEDETHIPIYFNYDFHTVVISEIRTYEKKRLENYIGKVSDYLLTKLKRAAARFLSS